MSKEERTQKVSEEAYRISAKQLYEETSKRPIIPCSLSADIGLGGGIPLGATVLLGGIFKGGKTTLSLQYGANAQNLFGSKIFYFNIEGRLTKLVLSQIQGIKLDQDNFEVIMPPAILDEEGNVIGHKKWSSEEWFNSIGECIVNNPKSIIIVDSIAALSSEKEQSENMGYQDRGGKNKIEAEFCRKYGGLVVPSRVTLFLLTHIQANTSGYGPPLQLKAGNGVKHLADVTLFCKRIDKWPEQNERILGHDINLMVEANSLGPPFVEIKRPLRYGYGIDTVKDVIDNAINWDLIKKAGAWYYLPFNEIEGKVENLDPNSVTKETKCVKCNGENAIRNWFLIHPEQLKHLESIIRSKIFG